MRQGQQNRRGRGRNNNHNNNNNRKNQNPLTRSFESAGPDVKIRGTPSHIAEKYVSLARDAQSSGDPVLAENYLQHAEHYNRIILTFREQQVSQGGDPYAGGTLARTHSLNPQDNPDGEEFGEEESGAPEDVAGAQAPVAGEGQQTSPQYQQPQQQPFQNNRQERQFDNNQRDNNQRYDNRQSRYDNNRGDYRNNSHRQDRGDQQRFDRNDRNDRGDRQDFRNDRGNQDRGYRDNRGYQNHQGDGSGGGEGNGYRRRDRYSNPGNNNFERDAQPPPGFAPQSAPEAPVEQEQPAFLRRPVRRPRNEQPPQVDVPAAPAEGGEE